MSPRIREWAPRPKIRGRWVVAEDGVTIRRGDTAEFGPGTIEFTLRGPAIVHVVAPWDTPPGRPYEIEELIEYALSAIGITLETP